MSNHHLEEEAPALIGVGMQALVSEARRLGLTWTVRLATIVDTEDAGAVTGIYDGDTVPIGLINTTGNALVSQARVYVLMVPPSGNFIIGFAKSLGLVSNYNAVGASGTTAIGTYSNLPGAPSVTILKGGGTETKLLVDVRISSYNSDALGIADIGVQVDGTDYQVTRFFYNQALVHAAYGAQRLIPNLSAGLKTVAGRWLQAGVGTLTQNSDDWTSITVSEVRTE
jgi:hypothetical protein